MSAGLAPNEHYYEVVTPEYEMYPMGYDPPEPPEYGCDWAMVVATSAREAVNKAVKAWVQHENPCVYDGYQQRQRYYCERKRSDGENPWTGVRAQIMRCGHGFEYRGPLPALQAVSYT